jgi:uncharacterized protein (TIRG00374 family)
MKKKYLKYILHAVILVGVGLAALKYLNGREILEALRNFQYGYAPFILLLSVFYIVIKGIRFVVLIRPVSDVPWDTLVQGYIAGTAATLVPVGTAARAGLMKQVGIPVSKSSAPVIFSSILDQAAFAIGALFAALWFKPVRDLVLIVAAVLVLLILIFMIPVVQEKLIRAAEGLAKRFKIVDQWQDFRKSLGEVVTWRIMAMALGLTMIGLVLQIVMLDLSLRGFGLSVPYAAVFLAYILPAMIGRNSALPAGIGLTEAGMVGLLSSTANVDPDVATAAAAIFRIGTVLFQALLGALIYFLIWPQEVKEVAAPHARLSEDGD